MDKDLISAENMLRKELERQRTYTEGSLYRCPREEAILKKVTFDPICDLSDEDFDSDDELQVPQTNVRQESLC